MATRAFDMRKSIGLIFGLFCMLNLTSCTKPTKSPVEEYQELLKKLDSREIRTIEILCIPIQVDTEVTLTVEHLRKSYWYKITINFPYGVRNLEDALLKYSPTNETKFYNSNFRLGLLFFNKNKKEVYSMYFSDASPEVSIGNKTFMVSKDIFEAIAHMIQDPDQQYLEKQIDSWFPEKNENAGH